MNDVKKVEEILNKENSILCDDQEGYSLLHIAAHVGNKEIVELIINKLGIGEELTNATSTDGTTALHLACANGNLDVVKYLIEHGANINQENGPKMRAIHYAADKGQSDVIKYLLSQGDIDANAKNCDGQTALYRAIEVNKEDAVMAFIDSAKVNIEDENFSILHISACRGWANVMRRLLESPNIDINKKNEFGNTPVYDACYNKMKGIVDILLEDPRIKINEKNSNRRTVLDTAIIMPYTEIFKKLVNKSNFRDLTFLLGRIVYYGRADMVHILISCGIDADTGDRKTTPSPITTTPSYLIDNPNFITNTPDITKKGYYIPRTSEPYGASWGTPLYVAAEKGYINVIEALVNNGADINISDGNDWNAFHYAAMGDQGDTIRHLFSKGVELDSKKNSSTALHVAVSHRKINSVKALLDLPGIKANRLDVQGYTALLHLAVLKQDLHIIREMIKSIKVDLNIVTDSSEANLLKHMGITDSKTLDFDIVTAKGMTALDFAAVYGNITMIDDF